MQPPPPSQPPFQGYPRPAPVAGIRFEAISEAWAYFSRDMATWIGGVLIIGFFVVCIAFATGAASNVLTYGSIMPPAGAVPDMGGLLLGQAMQFAGNMVSYMFIAGLFKLGVKQVKGEPYSIADVFGGFGKPHHMLLAAFLTNLATLFGTLLCILPGLLLYGLFMFVQPILMDQQVSAIRAIGMSFDTLKPHLWMAMLFAIVATIIGGVGVLACCVGALFTMPVYALSISILYRDFFYQPQSYQPFPGYGNYPPPPAEPPRG